MAKYIVTCTVCKNKANNTEMFSIKVGNRNRYFCSESEYEEHIKVKKSKEELMSKFNELYVYVAVEILNYELGQITPPHLRKRIRKLNDNYEFDVIKYCIESLTTYLKKVVANTTFQDDMHMVNYVMVIIENNINDAYKVMKHKKSIEQKQKSHTIDYEIMNDLIEERKPISTKSTVSNGIMNFLDEEDY